MAPVFRQTRAAPPGVFAAIAGDAPACCAVLSKERFRHLRVCEFESAAIEAIWGDYQALPLDEMSLRACPALYKDAARICLKNHAIDSALWHIDEEQKRSPKDVWPDCFWRGGSVGIERRGKPI